MATNVHSGATRFSEAGWVSTVNCFQGQSQDCLEAQGWNKSYLNSSISEAKGQNDELMIFFFLS